MSDSDCTLSLPGLLTDATPESIEDREAFTVLRTLTTCSKTRPPIPRCKSDISRQDTLGTLPIPRKPSRLSVSALRKLQEAGKTGQLILEENAKLKAQLQKEKENVVRLQALRDERVHQAKTRKFGPEKIDRARRAFKKQKTMRLQLAAGVAQLPEDLGDDVEMRRALKEELQKQQIRNDMVAVHARQEEALLQALTAEHQNQSFREKQLATLEKEFEAISHEREKHLQLLNGVRCEQTSLIQMISDVDEGKVTEPVGDDDDGVSMEELQKVADESATKLARLREDIAQRDEVFASMKKQWQDKEDMLTKLMDAAAKAHSTANAEVNVKLAALQDEWTKLQIEQNELDMVAAKLRKQTKDAIANREKARAHDSFFIGSCSPASRGTVLNKSGSASYLRLPSLDASPMKGGVDVYHHQVQGLRIANQELRERVNDIKTKKSCLSKTVTLCSGEEQLRRLMDESSRLKDQIRFHIMQRDDEMGKNNERSGKLNKILDNLHADITQLDRDQELLKNRLKLVEEDLRQWRVNESKLKEAADERISKEFDAFIDELDQETFQWQQVRSKLWKEIFCTEARLIDQKQARKTKSQDEQNEQWEHLKQKEQEQEHRMPEMNNIHAENVAKHQIITDEIQHMITEMRIAQINCFKMELKLRGVKKERIDLTRTDKVFSNARTEEELIKEQKATLVLSRKLERLKMKLRFITDKNFAPDAFTNLGMIPATLVTPNIISIGADVKKMKRKVKSGGAMDAIINPTSSQSQIAIEREKSLATVFSSINSSFKGDNAQEGSSVYSPADAATEGHVICVSSGVSPAVQWVDGNVSCISTHDDHFELNRDEVLVYIPGTTLVPIDVKDLVLGLDVFGGVRMYKSGKVSGVHFADSSRELIQTNVVVRVNWASSVFPTSPPTHEELSTLRTVYNLTDSRTRLGVLDAIIDRKVCTFDKDSVRGTITRIEASSDCDIMWENSSSTTVPACSLTSVDTQMDEEIVVTYADNASATDEKQHKTDAGKPNAESNKTDKELYAVRKNMVLVRLTMHNATVGMNVLTLPPSREGVGTVVSISVEETGIEVDVRWDVEECVHRISTLKLDALCAPRGRAQVDRLSRKEVLLSEIKDPCVHIIVTTQDGKIGSVNSIAKDNGNKVKWTVRWMDGTETEANPKETYAITYDSVPETCVPLIAKDARLGRTVYHCSSADKGKGHLVGIESSTNHHDAQGGLLQCRVRWAAGHEDSDPVPLRDLRVLLENVPQIFDVTDQNDSFSEELEDDARTQALTRIVSSVQDKAHTNWKLSQKLEQQRVANEHLVTTLQSEQRIYDRLKFQVDRAHLELETSGREIKKLLRHRIAKT